MLCSLHQIRPYDNIQQHLGSTRKFGFTIYSISSLMIPNRTTRPQLPPAQSSRLVVTQLFLLWLLDYGRVSFWGSDKQTLANCSLKTYLFSKKLY